MTETQLEIARGQAEGWRNFLTAATGLLAAVLVLKGRENVAELPSGYRLTVLLLVAAGLLSLLLATFLAVRAVHGKPGFELKYVDAEKLLDWEREERNRIARLIRRACWATLLGVLATAAGIMVTWVAPGPDDPAATVVVHTRGASVCGELLATDGSGVTVRVKTGKDPDAATTIRHLDWRNGAVSVAPVDRCS
ncbi:MULTISPECIES: hypothetical protein [Streptomyces]|uniref:hypothetical protein n=1 Tax=Streptomyces TaxID=1883 RepID=UPI001FD79B2B|nr:hypothetical protein [Streptomyces durhamensis]